MNLQLIAGLKRPFSFCSAVTRTSHSHESTRTRGRQYTSTIRAGSRLSIEKRLVQLIQNPHCKNKTVALTWLGLSQLQLLNQPYADQYIDSVALDSKQLATHGRMLSQLQVHYQTMCIQADQLHCLTSIM